MNTTGVVKTASISFIVHRHFYLLFLPRRYIKTKRSDFLAKSSFSSSISHIPVQIQVSFILPIAFFLYSDISSHDRWLWTLYFLPTMWIFIKFSSLYTYLLPIFISSWVFSRVLYQRLSNQKCVIYSRTSELEGQQNNQIRGLCPYVSFSFSSIIPYSSSSCEYSDSTNLCWFYMFFYNIH